MKLIKIRNINEAIENVTEFAKDNQGTAPITMAHAVRVSAEKDKKIDKALKPKQKEVDELVKENERNAHKVPKTSDLKKMHLSEAKKERFIDLVDEIDSQLTEGGPAYKEKGTYRINLGAGYAVDQIGVSYDRYDSEDLVGITVEVDEREVNNPYHKNYLGDLQPARDIAARYADLGVTTSEKKVINSTKPVTRSTILTIWVPADAPAANRDPKFAKPEKKKELAFVGEAMISTAKSLGHYAEEIADEIAEFLDKTASIEDLDDYLDEYDIEHLTKAMDALNSFAEDYHVNESVDTTPIKDKISEHTLVSYEFPKFTRRDKQVSRNFNLEIVEDNDDSTVVVGDYGKVKAFAHDYLAYELVPDYLEVIDENSSINEAIVLNSVKNFRPSPEAAETLKEIREADKLAALDDIIAKMFPEEDPNADDINNLLINEKEWLFDMLNIREEK